MKLHSPRGMGQMAGLCCRQSPLRGAVGSLVVCALFVGAVFLWRYLGAPWPVWGGCAALAALIVPVAICDAVAKFGLANWVLWVRPDGLWINLRSYQNSHLVEAATVVHLEYEEIARAHRHIETWSTPGTRSGRSILWEEESLELQLASGDTRKIALALAEERGREPPGRVVLGSLRVAGKGRQQSVTVPAEGVIRIAWRGNGHDVVPPLEQVLAELSQCVGLADTTRTDRPNWRELSDAELNELIVRLVRSGDRIGAIQLLVRRRTCSTTEAHQFVEELDTRI